MFDFLKKKISGFVDSLVKKGEEKKEEVAPVKADTSPERTLDEIEKLTKEVRTEQEARDELLKQEQAMIAEKPVQAMQTVPKPVEIEERAPEPQPIPEVQQPSQPKPEVSQPIQPQPRVQTPIEKPQPVPKAQDVVEESEKELEKAVSSSALDAQKLEEVRAQKKQTSELVSLMVQQREKEERSERAQEKIDEVKKKASAVGLMAPPALPEQERSFAPKAGIMSKLKSLFSPTIVLTAQDCEEVLDEFELALLESDVSIPAAHFLVDDVRKRIVNKPIQKSALPEEMRSSVQSALLELLAQSEPLDFFGKLAAKKAQGEPFVVVFLGPNGMGKTTTIAKLAHLLKGKGFSVVIAAGDTFRAAAQEQLQVHADNIGVKVIKHQYGGDPAAVAFDAVAHAKANKIDVVLVDTAGRQETSSNLVKELQKVVRIVNPDVRLFVGEAIAGHALAEQVEAFKNEVGVDALVVSKLDCDAKGGSILSAVFESKTPIVFMGTGQEYKDLHAFDAQWFASKIAS